MAKGERHDKKDPNDLTPSGIKKAATVELTRLIKKIGAEFHTIDDEGKPINKVEALARLVWEKALGYTKEIMTAEGIKETEIAPDKAFIGMIWDRLEGKVAPAVKSDGKDKAKLSNRISEQSKRRLNQMSNNADDS